MPVENTENVVGEIVEEVVQPEMTEEAKLKAKNVRFIASKLLEVISNLPDNVIAKYELTPAKIDDVFKPISSDFYVAMAENNISLENLEDSIELIANVETLLTKRIINHFDPTLMYVYENVLGYADPYKQMGIGEWEKRRNDIAVANELSTKAEQ